MGKPLKAAIVTDIHYGIRDRGKLGDKAPRLMKKFSKAVDKHKPDVVIDIGDQITARNREQDKRYLKELSQYFNKMAAPVHHVTGNHDIVFLTKKDYEGITGSPQDSYSLDQGDYHLVFFNPLGRYKDLGALKVKQSDLEWLEQDLAATDKPVILFSHVPLDNVSETLAKKGFGDFAHRFGYPEKGKHVRKIMEDSGKVVLCMSGHIHRNRYREINGIHYVTQQSLTHKWKDKYKVPSGAWTLLEADENKITVTLKGKTKKTYELTPRPLS